ncbi:hypothetical protein CJP72_15435 [Citrobacter sp. NCU1]|uniref:tape measure protein n=1 Tax=Citrobacter sp. NCU1 TaxID=2026683 RepID=UPI001390F8ED|nr:tape measure protein [Citrobacter sp. NCU1]NDO82105.1 hypothetical protein [Citrobacter sp. NCU1]
MAGGTFTVSEFVVEMNFDASKVLRGLESLERKSQATAVKIEKQLNSAFLRLNGAQKTGDMFARIQRQASQTATHIQRELQRGFAVGGVGTGMFTRYESEGVRAAERVREALRETSRAGRPESGSNPRPYTPRPRQGLAGADAIRDIHQRQTTSSFYGNMQLRNPEQAADYRRRLDALRNESLMNNRSMAEFRQSLRALNFEFGQTMRQASMQCSQQRLAAANQSGGIGGGMFGKLGGAAAALTLAFAALNQTVEFFNQSLEEGRKRERSNLMMKSAFGDNAGERTRQVDAIADKYGVDKVTMRETYAKSRSSFDIKKFSDADVLKMMEEQQVYATAKGVTVDELSRANVGLRQIAGNSSVTKEDFNQLVENVPALAQDLARTLNVSSGEVYKKLKTMTPADVVAIVNKTIEQSNERNNSKELAANSFSATEGRYYAAIKDAQNKFFSGFAPGLIAFYEKMTRIITDNSDILVQAGEWVGDFLLGVANAVEWIVRLTKAYIEFNSATKKFTSDMLDAVKGWFVEMFNSLPDWVRKPILAFGNSLMNSFSEIFNWILDKLESIPGFGKLIQEARQQSRIESAANTLNDDLMAINPKPLFAQYDVAEMFPGLYSPVPALTQLPQTSSSQSQRILVEVKSDPQKSQQSIDVNLRYPDGYVQTIKADFENSLNNRLESQIMTAQGLGGSWQSPGQNAGFSPSLLRR